MVTRERNILIDCDGGSIGLRIDNWVLKETQKKAGCKGIIELFKKIGFDDSNIDLESFIILIMEAANEYNYHQKIDQRIDEREASDYIDRMGGIISALSKVAEGLNQFDPNQATPEKAGDTEKISQ